IGVFFHPQEIDDNMRSALGLGKNVKGVLVTKVIEGGPADKAGVFAKDVVVSVDGKATYQPHDFVNQIGLLVPGSQAQLEVIRRGKKRAITVTIAEREENNAVAQKNYRNVEPDEDLLGLKLAFEDGKVIVAGGSRNSRAAGRLMRGDVLVSVGEVDLEKFQDFSKALEAIKSEIKRVKKERRKGIMFIVHRESGYLSIPIVLED
ncbi:MAG: PDZ domain-containing protein, partial [Zetaproteobacteria bacterium]|nr:PDZ domain-containing protein [Zetaproteobacteria bacterium]